MARNYVQQAIQTQIGGTVSLRADFTTDNGNIILDVAGLQLTDCKQVEMQLNHIAGVVTNGLFAQRSADLLLIATPDGVQVIRKK